MPNSDPWDRFVHPYLTLMSDSYSLACKTGFLITSYRLSICFSSTDREERLAEQIKLQRVKNEAQVILEIIQAAS